MTLGDEFPNINHIVVFKRNNQHYLWELERKTNHIHENKTFRMGCTRSQASWNRQSKERHEVNGPLSTPTHRETFSIEAYRASRTSPQTVPLSEFETLRK